MCIRDRPDRAELAQRLNDRSILESHEGRIRAVDDALKEREQELRDCEESLTVLKLREKEIQEEADLRLLEDNLRPRNSQRAERIREGTDKVGEAIRKMVARREADHEVAKSTRGLIAAVDGGRGSPAESGERVIDA